MTLLAVMLGLPAFAYAQTVSGGASPQTMINNRLHLHPGAVW